MLRFFGLLFVVAILVGGILLFRILTAAGYFEPVTPKFAGTCRTVEGVIGAEDMELDRATGLLFISSQDRRFKSPADIKPGNIYLAAIEKPEQAPRPLLTDTKDFHPHGISLFADAAGRRTLAVVNHTSSGDEVVLFDVAIAADGNAALTERRKVKDPLMHSLNDVTLVTHEAFYVTNDHGSETELGEQLETWLLLPRANVVYYDGNAAKQAASGFNYANGINRNVDGSEIYVAEATGRTLSTFRRDPETGVLVHTHSLAIPMGLDNIDVDSEGHLWIGAHPHLLDFLAHAADPKKLSPSAAVKVTLAGDASTFEPVYVNAGEEISGSSVAIHDKNRLVIGPVLDPKFLNCLMD